MGNLANCYLRHFVSFKLLSESQHTTIDKNSVHLMKFDRYILLFAAGFFFLYGFAFGLVPKYMALLITNDAPMGSSALVDFRATFGGLNLAVGFVLFYLVFNHQIKTGLVVIGVVLVNMAVSRLLGLLIEQEANFFMYLFLLLEIGGAILAIYRIYLLPKNAH